MCKVMLYTLAPMIRDDARLPDPLSACGPSPPRERAPHVLLVVHGKIPSGGIAFRGRKFPFPVRGPRHVVGLRGGDADRQGIESCVREISENQLSKAAELVRQPDEGFS
jgi:hypothetical protein